MQKWCLDMIKPKYMIWAKLQILLVALSFCFGYFLFGWVGLLVLGKQSAAHHAGPARRGGLQPKHLVAWSASGHSVGRKLARQSSRLSCFSFFQLPMVVD